VFGLEEMPLDSVSMMLSVCLLSYDALPTHNDGRSKVDLEGNLGGGKRKGPSFIPDKLATTLRPSRYQLLTNSMKFSRQFGIDTFYSAILATRCQDFLSQ
jgi:hypothetical protein